MASRRELRYQPLASEPKFSSLSDSDGETDAKAQQLTLHWSRISRRRRRIRAASLVSLAMNLFAALYLAVFWMSRSSYVVWRGARPLYTPVDEPPHKNVLFTSLTGTSIYHGPPTDEVDANWQALYAPYLTASLNEKQASLLPNKTEVWPGTELYQGTVSVFHHIHCLNFLRALAWPERYPGAEASRYGLSHGKAFSHADHCIEALRESLICNAPIAPLPWQFNPVKNYSEIRFDVTQTCSDFSAVQRWVDEHPPPGGLTLSDGINKTLPAEFIPTHEQLVAAGWEE